jgi:uncharacterized protein with beta-barrel porin domain
MSAASRGKATTIGESTEGNAGGKPAEGGATAPADWGAWVAGTAQFATRDTTESTPGYHYTTASPIIGLDYRVTHDFLLGAIFSFADTSLNFSNSGGTLDIDTELAGLYAVWAHGGFQVNGLAGYGFNQYEVNRPAFAWPIPRPTAAR